LSLCQALQRTNTENWKQIFLEKGIARPHSAAENMWTDPVKNRSETHECGN
jgi:hypothetical protein